MNNKKILMLGTAIVSLTSFSFVHTAHAVTASITMTATTDINFGRFAPNAGSPGTVTITPGGGQTFTGGIVDGGSVGIAQAAGFTISGDPLVDIQITATGSSLVGGGPAMPLSTIKFSLNPADTDTTTFQIPTTTSTVTFSVGATISVANAATQTQGIYIGGITLTANYL